MNKCSNIFEIFRDIATKTPDTLAILSDQEEISYAELLSLSTQLANKLKYLGLRTGGLVPILLERSCDYIVAILAILQAGGTYVPIDIHSPKSRITQIINDTQASIVITRKKYQQLLDKKMYHLVYCERNHVIVKESMTTTKPLELSTFQLANVIYTSGTTGKPKGVMVKHSGIINLVKEARIIDVDQQSIIACNTHICFDVSTFEIWSALLNGATLAIIPEDAVFSIRQFEKLLHKFNIDTLWLTSGLFNQLFAENKQLFSSLRYLLIGGEALNVANIRLLLQQEHRPSHIINGYGPTEATVFSSFYLIKEVALNQASIPIGKPIKYTSIKILSEEKLTDQVNVSGEICITGAGLSAGYLNNKELTSENFISIKNHMGQSENWYKTGDIGHYLPDKNIQYQGRIDRQIKIRGYRVECQEIEHVINQIEGIKNSKVCLESTTSQQDRIIAYISHTNCDHQELEKQILNNVKDFLPTYMIPNKFVFLNNLPLTPSGKISQTQLLENNKRPSSQIFRCIEALFSQLLATQPIQTNISFFDIGGDSLLAIRLIYQLEQRFHIELSLPDIFSHPSVNALSRFIAKTKSPTKSSNQALAPTTLPLTKTQLGIWLQNQTLTERSVYYIPIAIKMSRNSCLTKLHRSLKDIINKSPALRTVFSYDKDNNPVQTIHQNIEFKVNIIYTDIQQDTKQNQHLQKIIQQTDLSNGERNFSFSLIHHPNKIIFLAIFHHLIFDGYSKNIFINAFYTTDFYRKQNQSQLDQKYLQALQKQIDYDEKKKLSVSKNISTIDFQPNSTNKSTSTAVEHYHLYISNQDYQRIKKYAKELKTSIFIVSLTLFQISITKHSQQTIFDIGIPYANLARKSAEDMMGCFIDVRSVRATFESSICFEKALHNNIDNLFKNLSESNHSPINCAFVDDAKITIDNNHFKTINIPPEFGLLDLRTIFKHHNHNIEIIFEYRKSVLPQQYIRSLSCQYTAAIEKYLNIFDNNINKIFLNSVNNNPENIAISSANMDISYHVLNDKSNQLARHLQSIGVKQGDIVAIVLPRGIEYYITLLAVLKMGAAYLPVDMNYPKKRIQHILNDSNSKLLITNGKEKLQYDSHGTDLLYLDEIDLQSYDISNIQDIHTKKGDLAYVIYTSGSTGKPKGVQISHGNLCNLATHISHNFSITSSARVLQFFSPGFDAAVAEWCAAFAVGATLCIPHINTHSNQGLLEAFLDSNITVATITPSFANLLPTSTLEKLDTLIVAGECCSAELAKKLLPHVNLINAYGPTEATVCTTYKKYTINDIDNNIGSVINNVKVYILDKQQNLVSHGEEGEIYIGGDSVGLGYCNNLTLTTEKFIVKSIDGKHERLYKTGDIGRFINTIDIQFIGRVDSLIKIRGYRVEPIEVETAICEHPEIKHAIVNKALYAQQDKLTAYLITQEILSFEQFAVIKKDIKHLLSTTLASYMIPEIYISIEKIPFTEHGKIDYQALSNIKPLVVKKESIKQNTIQHTPIIDQLIKLFKKTLDVEEISIEDNFFDIGVDSLTCIKLSLNAKEKGLAIDINQFFEHPSIKELSRALKPEDSTEKVPSNPIFLSPFQQGLLFSEHYHHDLPIYNIHFVCEISGRLDSTLLSQAYAHILQRHEILRSKIHYDQNNNPKFIVEESNKNLSIIDLQYENDSQILKKHIEDEIRTPFELGNDFLIRCTLYQSQHEKHTLVLVIHHIICDGHAMDVFLSELSEAYNSYLDDTPLTLTSSPHQYTHYLQDHNDQKYFSEDQHFWSQQLNDINPYLNLGCGNYSKNISAKGKTKEYSLTHEDSAKIIQLAKNENTTVFIILLSLFKILLYKYVNQDKIVVGIPTSQRTDKSLEQTIGPLINSLAIITKMTDDTTIKTLFKTVRKTVFSAYAHCNTPFDRIVNALNFTYSDSRNPIFQVCFSEETSKLALQLSDTSNQDIFMDNGTAKFDLTLMFANKSGNINLFLEYRTDLFEERVIDHLLYEYQELILQMLDTSRTIKQIISNHNVLPNQTKEASVINMLKPVHKQFEDQLTLNKHRDAIVTENGPISYTKLNQKANQLANILLTKGISSGEIIGVFLDKSVNAIIAMLAILKAGATYLPLDVHNPEERIRFILDDSKAKIIITEKKYEKSISHHKEQLLLMENINQLSSTVEFYNPELPISNDTLAYIIYTSGTTGQPKGVMITHQALASLFKASKQIFNFNVSDRWCLFHSIAFDFSIWEMLGPLLHGSALTIVPHLVAVDPEEFLTHLVKHNITILNQTPTALYQLLSLPKFDFTQLKQLRYIICGGEKLDLSILKKLIPHPSRKIPDIYNLYGSTESTIHTTYQKIDINDDRNHGNSPIGIPLSHVDTLLLDKHMNPVPQGATGEIYISGPGLAKGYLNQDTLTEEKFGKDRSLYKTGDIARRLNDDSYEYIGRSDKQIKIRGHRIECSEIESVLNNISNIERSIIVPHQQKNNGLVLIAYLKPSHNNIDINQLIKTAENHLTNTLPCYMQPMSYEIIKQIPLTTNGKVDIKKLPEPTFHFKTNNKNYKPPRNAIESLICRRVEELLHLPSVGINDDFFEVGGSSISAIKLTLIINQHYQTNIRVKELYESAKISDIATLITRRYSKNNDDNIIPICHHSSHKKSLFLIHPSSGLSLCYSTLSPFINSKLSVSGINNPYFSDKNNNYNTLEEMAAAYIKEIKLQQPTGPYNLGGWSFGGLVAFEMAMQLNQAGETVSNLIMMDAFNKDLLVLEKQTPLIIQQDLIAEGINPDTIEGQFFSQEIMHNWTLSINYQPSIYSGNTTLIRAQQSLPISNFDSVFNGWNTYLSQPANIYSIACRHGAMLFESNASLLANIINQLLTTECIPTTPKIKDQNIFNSYVNHAKAIGDNYLENVFLQFINQ